MFNFGKGWGMRCKAFTIMELMVVVIVVGVIAAFAIPNYTKANNRAEERQMIVNLRSIISAQEIYKAQNGSYWPAGAYAVPTGNQGLPQLNTDLKLNIISDSKYTYVCSSDTAQDFECFASYSSAGTLAWQIYTNIGIAHGTTYPNQVCCVNDNPGYPCPSLPACL